MDDVGSEYPHLLIIRGVKRISLGPKSIHHRSLDAVSLDILPRLGGLISRVLDTRDGQCLCHQIHRENPGPTSYLRHEISFAL